MKRFLKTELFSLFSIILGIVGMALQSWLFSTADSQGLLLHGHMAEILSYILLAVFALVNFLFLKDTKPTGAYSHLFPQSLFAGIGSILAGLGIGLSAFSPEIVGVLRLVVKILGIASAAALGYAGYCRLQGKRPNCLLFAVVALFLIFRTLAFCQKWSAEVQVQTYFFPLLGGVSLLMAAYYRAAIGADMKGCRQYLFFRQLAIFCCLMSVAGGEALFYLAGAVWMATDACNPEHFGKYIQ